MQSKLFELEKEYNLLAVAPETSEPGEHEQIDTLLARDEEKATHEIQQLMTEAKITIADELKKIVIRAYFDNSFVFVGTCASRATLSTFSTENGSTTISRTELRNSINHILVLMGFEGMGKLDPLWQDWFLGSYLGLPKSERNKGKRLVVVSLVSDDNVIRTLEVLLQQLKK